MIHRTRVIARFVSFLVVSGLGAIGGAWTAASAFVDTGQDQCYDDAGPVACPSPGQAFYGQDAQYEGDPPKYVISGDGLTVDDVNTGLTWVKKPDTDGDGDLDTYDQLTWPEFEAYPETLNAHSFGGYDDWRTPTIKELYSLIDFRGLDPSGPGSLNLVPFIDTTYFDFVYGDESAGERIIDAQYWSNNQYVGTVFGGQTAVFGVNFADGRIKGYPRDMGPSGVAVHFVRCVRGGSGYGVNVLVDNEDGTITDNSTGLMWMQDDVGGGTGIGPRSGMLWADALAFAENLTFAGYSDWRLPNAKEMQSILDYTRAPDATGTAAIDPIFHITQITNERGEADYPWFWTSTTHALADGSGPSAAYVCFGRALGYFMGSWLDVHGAGAQRSDRKDGDFSQYTYVSDGYYFAIAPQGDAARMYNYVRCVRDLLPTAVGEANGDGDVPNRFALQQNRPNPFNPTTTIRFRLPESDRAVVRIYSVTGEEVATLVDDNLSAGEHEFTWRSDRQPSGVYFCVLDAAGSRSTIKMLLLR